MDDILVELKNWLARLYEDPPPREAALPPIHIDLVIRAVAEIERLRDVNRPLWG
jgi:hypothetical protein